MKPTIEAPHAFIVRLWTEPRALKTAEPIWRGVIEDVEDGKKIYFDRLSKLSHFFAKYLEGVGITLEQPES